MEEVVCGKYSYEQLVLASGMKSYAEYRHFVA